MAKKLYVKDGLSLTTKQGIVAGGSLITSDMVEGGADKLALLEKKGFLTAKEVKDESKKDESKKTTGAVRK